MSCYGADRCLRWRISKGVVNFAVHNNNNNNNNKKNHQCAFWCNIDTDRASPRIAPWEAERNKCRHVDRFPHPSGFCISLHSIMPTERNRHPSPLSHCPATQPYSVHLSN